MYSQWPIHAESASCLVKLVILCKNLALSRCSSGTRQKDWKDFSDSAELALHMLQLSHNRSSAQHTSIVLTCLRLVDQYPFRGTPQVLEANFGEVDKDRRLNGFEPGGSLNCPSPIHCVACGVEIQATCPITEWLSCFHIAARTWQHWQGKSNIRNALCFHCLAYPFVLHFFCAMWHTRGPLPTRG